MNLLKKLKTAPKRSSAKFEVKQLSIREKPLQVKSIPLLIPNNTTYNPKQGLVIDKGVVRASLTICPIALELLETINKPVAVLSIAGPTRTGKSYILSRFLDDPEAFELGHTMRSHTKGIWMSTSVLDCSEYCILLIDTEGIDSATDTTSNDAKILVSTLLMSSYFIYNSVGVPHNNDLEKMSIFMNMTKTVVVRQGKETSDYWRIYPPFLWLLRDVLLEVPKIDGKEVTATEYLKREVLLEGSDMGSDICKALVNFFPSFECKILSPPSLSEDTMKHVAENMHQLNPSFNEGVERLLTFLENNVKPKKIFDAAGRGCDGRTLAELVKVIAKEVDAGATLALDNTWKLVVESRCQAVQKNLLAKYITTVQDCYEKASGGLPIEQIADADTITVMGIHTQVWGNIQTMLSSELGSLLSAHVTEDYTLHTVVKQLEDQIIVHDQSQVVIGGALFSVIEENRRRSSKYCTNLFHESYTPLKKKVAAGKDGYSTADLEADIETLFQDYDKTAIGPEKLQVRSEMKKSIEENQEIFAKHLEELIKRTQEETEARKIQESLRNELQSLNESRRQLDAKFSEFTDQQRKAEKKRTEETEEEVRKLKERVEMHEIKEKEMHEKEIHLVGEEAKRKAEAEYMRKMSEAKINDLKTTLERNRKEAEAQKATFNQEIEDMQKSLKEKENENDKFKDEKQREIEEMEETLRKMREKETARIAEADEQLDKIKQDLEKKQGQAKKQQARLEKELHDTEHKLEQQKLESEQMDKDFLKTIRDLEEENEKERKMKVLASEEAQNTRERLDQVVETGKEREAQIKISWQQKLAEKEKTKDDLSGKIDKLTKAIHAFENKPLVKLFGYKIVRK